MANGAFEALIALTLESVRFVYALAVDARIGRARIHLTLAELTGEAEHALALFGLVVAFQCVIRVTDTAYFGALAEGTRVLGRAFACERIDAIDTRGTVLTRHIGTVVHVGA